MKKKIFHIIGDLGLGGAEQLLVGILPKLSEYEHIIITLDNQDNNKKNHPEDIKVISLDFNKNKNRLPKTILKLKKLINQYQPSIIHTNLFWATIIGRLACPKKTKLVTTYHSLLYDKRNTQHYSRKMEMLDKFTYRDKYHTIFISKAVKKAVGLPLNITKNCSIIHNYVHDKYTKSTLPSFSNTTPIRGVSVGNLRSEKDHKTLVKAISSFSSEEITLDIYGEGPERKNIEEIIQKNSTTNVQLKGRNPNLDKLLSDYHLYFMPSRFEGFGIALAEALVVGLPAIASDIETFKEVGGEDILYFKVGDVDSLSTKIKNILKDKKSLQEMSNKLIKYKERFNSDAYANQLKEIYEA